MDIWDYLKSYNNIKQDNPEKLETFIKGAGGELVPLHTVAMALDDLSLDMGTIIGEMAAVQEERLRHIVECLDGKAEIYQKFKEVGDDLFSYPAEGENNHAEENN